MAIGGFFQAAGFAMMAQGARTQGKMTQAAKRFESAQARRAADDALAAGAFNVRDQKRQARLVQSRIQALVAAGGGGTMDPTVVNLIGEQEAEGAFRAAFALYDAQSKARNLRMQASIADYEGESARYSGRMQGIAYGLSAIGAAAGAAASPGAGA